MDEARFVAEAACFKTDEDYEKACSEALGWAHQHCDEIPGKQWFGVLVGGMQVHAASLETATTDAERDRHRQGVKVLLDALVVLMRSEKAARALKEIEAEEG